jgi:hypothetical protein
MKIAPQFKIVYEAYARNNPKFTNLLNRKKYKQLNKYELYYKKKFENSNLVK